MLLQRPKVCIIGFGRMGKRCASLFSPGFDIEIVSRRNVEAEARKRGARQSEDPKRSLSKADYIMLAVPIWALDIWVPRINELTKPSCIVMDCCTARLASNKKLLNVERRRFGVPEIGAMELYFDGEPDSLLQSYLEAHGYRLYPISSENPDRRPVSGIAHFIGMALDLNLTQEDRSVLSKGGAGQCLLKLIAHLKSNSPSTYMETQLFEPGMSACRKEVIEWLKTLDEELAAGEFRFESYPPDQWRE